MLDGHFNARSFVMESVFESDDRSLCDGILLAWTPGIEMPG
ncbi:MAG: hypothetical protein ACI8T1_004843 [Verrucomicrobiales bacterium]|jgi:hypothetical protein